MPSSGLAPLVWNVTAFICILIGASIPLGLFDASFVTGLVGAVT
jgi:hypothetical protein